MIRLTLSVLLVAAAAAPAAAQTVAIENATVHVKPGTTLEDATVVIRNGTIAAAGKGVAIPAGATRIDGRGKVVTAGFIEASTTLGLTEVDQVRETQEGAFAAGDDTVYAAFQVADGFNPRSVAIPLARTGGITSAVCRPRGGLVSGTSAFVSLRSGSAADMTVTAPLAMHASLGQDALASARGSRGMAVMRLRELLDDARDYQRRRAGYERNQTREFATSRLNLEALGLVVDRRVPLVVTAHKSSDILAALRLEKELGVRVIIEGGTEAWLVARELAAASSAVILDPLDNLPDGFDSLQVREDNAARLAAAGVRIALSSRGDAAHVRILRQRAGQAVAWGLPRDAALAAITTGPAAMFGLRDRGTLERGKVADLVLWSGDPFELSTRAERVFIGGVEQTLDSRQKQLLQRYLTVPSRR